MQAIRDLVVTYAMAFDDRDWDRLRALWTDDAAWVGPDHGTRSSRATTTTS